MPTWLDAIVIVVVVTSAVLAMVRGLVRELLSIASWAAAAVAGVFFYKPLVPHLQPYVGKEFVAIVIAVAAIFFVTLIVASYITMKISDFVIDSRIGAIDRSLGFVFGVARGFLLVVIALFLFEIMVQKNRPAAVTEAKSEPILRSSGEWLVSLLPTDVVKYVSGFLHKDETPSEEGSAPDTGEPAGDLDAPDAPAGNKKKTGLDAAGVERTINNNGTGGATGTPNQ